MLVTYRRWTTSTRLALLVSLAGRAFAQDSHAAKNATLQECARSYESSQVHRGAGALSSARSELDRCQRDDCPAFIRSDCARWAKEVEAEQPTVIFSARRDARELTDVRVSVGDRVLVERLNGQALPLDPGEYDFRFETGDGVLIVQHSRIQAFNKDRLVQVEVAPVVPPRHPAREPGPAAIPIKVEVAPEQAETSARPGRTLPWLLLTAGAASFGAGAGLAAWGYREEADLRETCAPNCTDSQVQPVRTKYLLSDISFGIGLLSLSAAAYLFLQRPAPEQTATLPITMVASPSGVQAAYGARF